MKNKKKKGFTLTELIVVIVIIGVLAAVLIPSLTGYITKAQDAKDNTLVASLNKSYANSKIIEDDLYFYTAYDVKEFLKSIEMENVEVANKKNLILFDTNEDKFVLIKENSEYLGETTYGNHTSEFYTIRSDYYEPKTIGVSGAILVKLDNSVETDNEPTYNRSFIVSTSGNVISEVVAMYINIENVSESECQDYITKMLAKLTDKKYTSFKNHLIDDLSKTLFMKKVDTDDDGEVDKDICFYIDEDYNYKMFYNSETVSAPENQKLTRVVVLPSVDTVRLDVASSLNNSVVVLPNSATEVYVSSNVTTEICGNTEILEESQKTIYNDYIHTNINSAYNKAKLRELINVDNQVSSEQELRDVMNTYKKINGSDEESNKIKKAINDLLASDPNRYNSADEILNNIKEVIITETFEIKNDIDIYVNIRIPYEKTQDDYKCGDSDENGGTEQKFAHLSSDNKKFDLTVAKDVIVNVYGRIEVGGITGDGRQGMEGHTTGSYAQITLNGEIILMSSAKLDIYGYIVGEGKITIKDGAALTQPFIIGDFGGGTKTYILTQNVNRVPFSKYALCNVTCSVKVEYGGIYQGRAKIWIDTPKKFYTSKCIVVGNKISEGMFNLQSDESYVEIEYKENKKLKSGDAFDLNVGKSEYKVYGDVKTGSFQIELQIGKTSLTKIKLDTSKYVLGIPYNFSFEFNSGVCTVNSSLAALPGCEIKIASDATLVISSGKQVYITEEDAAGFNYSGDNKYYPSVDSLKAAGYETKGKLTVNGTLIINGTFGGKIFTEDNNINDKHIEVSDSAIIENTKVVFGADKDERYLTKKYNGSELILSFENAIAIGKSDNSTILEKGEKYVYSSDGKWIKETTIETE